MIEVWIEFKNIPSVGVNAHDFTILPQKDSLREV